MKEPLKLSCIPADFRQLGLGHWFPFALEVMDPLLQPGFALISEVPVTPEGYMVT